MISEKASSDATAKPCPKTVTFDFEAISSDAKALDEIAGILTGATFGLVDATSSAIAQRRVLKVRDAIYLQIKMEDLARPPRTIEDIDRDIHALRLECARMKIESFAGLPGFKSSHSLDRTPAADPEAAASERLRIRDDRKEVVTIFSSAGPIECRADPTAIGKVIAGIRKAEQL